MKMIQQAIEMSKKEEEERKQKDNQEIHDKIKMSEEKFVEKKPIAAKASAPVKVEAPIAAPIAAPQETAQPPKDLIEIKAPAGMSDAELKKLEELR